MRNILLATALLATTGIANAAAFTNGGFEAPVIGSSYVTYDAPSAAITGWNVTAGNVDIITTAYGAHDGNQALDLVGTTAGTISQTFDTVAGGLYQLSFWYSHNAFSTGAGAADFSVGSLSSSVLHNSGSTGNLDWKLYTGLFTAAPGTSSTLTFANTVGGNNGGLFLDSVSIAAVPEPASWAMMIGGLGLVGATMRRRAVRVAFA